MGATSADVIRRQRFEVAKARSLRLLGREFNPNQPRDEEGKWTSDGGAPTTFVSPNVSNLTFDQAVAGLGSQRQAHLRQASAFIDGRLGLTKVETNSVIGAWADGAENSMMISAQGASTEQMRAASAMKGWLADQKSVLVFDPAQDGDAFMANFDLVGKPEDVHAKLLKDGLAFHTLQPMGANSVRVHVFGSDQDTVAAIKQAIQDTNAKVRITPGRGEFLGTTKDTGSDREQRDDARRVYDETIRQISDSGGVAGRDVAKIWNEARDYWQSISAAKGLKFDPDQPRDEDGKWSSGGGGGGGSDAKPSGTPEVAPARLTRSQLQSRIDVVANDAGYDSSKIGIGSETRTFMLNGKEYTYAGWFDRNDIETPIRVFENHVNQRTVDGLIHHEIQHAKFDNALDRYHEELREIENEDRPAGTPASRDPVMFADGRLKPPYDEKYPAYTAMHEAYYRHDPFSTGSFADADGVSGYSYEYWKKWKNGGKLTYDFNAAVHETLAEMSRLKAEEGKLPNHYGEGIIAWRGEDKPKPPQSVIDANRKRWQNLYEAVDKVYKL